MSEQLRTNESAEGGLTEERYLSFSLGGGEYAIPLLAVKEVIGIPGITPMPQSPEHFLGIINLRGLLIPVLDLRRKLSVKPREKPEPAIIICDMDGTSVGVVVDSVNSVIFPKANELSPSPAIPTGKAEDYVKAVYRREKSLVLILDIARALDVADRAQLAKVSQQPVSA